MTDQTPEENIGTCSYCGRELVMQPEHVVPRAIFINENQSNIVIDACQKCNNDKSAGEDDLRDWLIIAVDVDGHPEIRQLIKVMAESIGKGFSAIGKAAREERAPTLRTTPGGL